MTFSIPPIEKLLDRYLDPDMAIVDPFARNANWGTHTNDLNPDTYATYHMDAVAFLDKMLADGVQADALLFDPPFGARQVRNYYQNFGHQAFRLDNHMKYVKQCREGINKIMKTGGIVISFGYNSNGMSKARGYEIVEIMLVAHGGVRYDTIVVVERKL